MTRKWLKRSRASLVVALLLVITIVAGWSWSPVHAERLNLPASVNMIAVGTQTVGTSKTDTISTADKPAKPADEQPKDAAAATGNPLYQLAWMLGAWSDGAQGNRVENEVRWAEGGRFLSRDYRQFHDGQVALSGTQIIGWDAVEGALHSWSFDSDGSVGQGHWHAIKDGGWRCQQVLTLADGRRGAFTQIIKPASATQMEITTLDVELDGHLRPGFGPHKLTREPSAGGFLTP